MHKIGSMYTHRHSYDLLKVKVCFFLFFLLLTILQARKGNIEALVLDSKGDVIYFQLCVQIEISQFNTDANVTTDHRAMFFKF